MAAGSLLGVALHKETSFPVGKVEFMNLYPMSFSEYLLAAGEEQLLDLLHQKDWDLIHAFRDRYVRLLKTYYFVGGMPEAVQSYISTHDFVEVRTIQHHILSAYELDFSKHAPAHMVPRIRMLWNAIPSQLSRENKKFVYGLLKKGARAKEYEMALAWLVDSGLIHRVGRVMKPGFPLKAYEDFGAFKLYLVDVGLLCAISDLSSKIILEGHDIFKEFKGAMTEQFVLQQLKATFECPISYWSAERGMAEVDFVVQHQENIIPIEVKAEENLQSKSLKSYVERYKPDWAFRVSMSNYRAESWLVNWPMYAINEVFPYQHQK